MFKIALSLLAVVSLSACGGSAISNALGGARIQVPAPTPPPAGLTPTEITSPAGGGFTFGISSGGSNLGGVINAGAQGYAQLLPTTVNQPPLTGGTVMNGTYSLDSLTLVPPGSPPDPSDVQLRNQPISLTASFTDKTLTGTAGSLAVNTTITNGILGGTVTYNGVSTSNMQGVISDDRAIGAFVIQSNTEGVIVAGGFDVSE
ncbi:hypothetical protein [Yoonia sp. 208BN28-4]|uniref:hypothetical protein n=1 Tax=Yoonia sp. 208BN28-4 TaxID=3126505 RepID=UPI0030A93380